MSFAHLTPGSMLAGSSGLLDMLCIILSTAVPNTAAPAPTPELIPLPMGCSPTVQYL